MSFADLPFFIFMIVLKSSSSLGGAVFTLFSGKFCSFFRNSGAFVNSGGYVSCFGCYLHSSAYNNKIQYKSLTCKEKETIGMGQGHKPASWVSGTTPLHSLNPPPKKIQTGGDRLPATRLARPWGKYPQRASPVVSQRACPRDGND